MSDSTIKLKEFLDTEDNKQLLIQLYIDDQIVRAEVDTWAINFDGDNIILEVNKNNFSAELSLIEYKYQDIMEIETDLSTCLLSKGNSFIYFTIYNK